MDPKNQNDLLNENIKELFQGKKWKDRADAARKLGYLKDARATNSLAKALKTEKDKGVINMILESMGRIEDPNAASIIINFLKEELGKDNPDKTRLFIIIESLMKIGDKKALKHLGILVNSCDDDIKTLTEEAFECIDPNWKENVKKYITRNI